VKSTSFRRAIVPGIAALALLVAGCGAGNEDDSSSDGSSSDSALSGTLNGGGASSQEKAQAAWRAGFQGDNPDATINYDPVGSGTGRENFINGAYSFAGTDSAINNDEGELDAATERCGDDVIQVPAYVSPIAVIYNLDGVDDLSLSAEVIANIFNGSITTWDDPAIADLNPNADLPGDAITPVHRQDDSGTTDNFTQYLAAAGNGAWGADPDGVWPADYKGEAAEGTSGVVGAVTDGSGTIGYADASAAADLGVVAIQVGEEFNTPSAEGAAQVVANSPTAEGASPNDMAVEVDRTTTESGSYPLLLVSYLLACPSYDSAEEADLVKGYLTYVVSDAGQQAAADEAGSAPLDSSLSEQATSIIDSITSGS
jgi:phosphate transport system substrate-binding protein